MKNERNRVVDLATAHVLIKEAEYLNDLTHQYQAEEDNNKKHKLGIKIQEELERQDGRV